MERRAEIARLLKGARWWSAGVQPTNSVSRESVPWKLRELTTAELAARSPLAENGWTAKRLGRVERMERDLQPVELDMIERALGLPGLFDTVSRPRIAEDPPAALERSARGLETTSVRLPRLGFHRAEDGPSGSPRS